MRSLASVVLALPLTACGPFRPPAFDSLATLSRDATTCVTTIHGTWPNLPHDPRQWFVGGRTNLTVTVHSPNSQGRHVASELTVYYAWPNSAPYSLEGLSGYVEFRGDQFVVELAQSLDGSTKNLEMNGIYAVGNQAGCA